MVQHIETIIIGSGPTGLGAATRLQQHEKDDWLLIEQSSDAGGLGSFIIYLPRDPYSLMLIFSNNRCNRRGIPL